MQPLDDHVWVHLLSYLGNLTDLVSFAATHSGARNLVRAHWTAQGLAPAECLLRHFLANVDKLLAVVSWAPPFSTARSFFHRLDDPMVIPRVAAPHMSRRRGSAMTTGGRFIPQFDHRAVVTSLRIVGLVGRSPAICVYTDIRDHLPILRLDSDMVRHFMDPVDEGGTLELMQFLSHIPHSESIRPLITCSDTRGVRLDYVECISATLDDEPTPPANEYYHWRIEHVATVAHVNAVAASVMRISPTPTYPPRNAIIRIPLIIQIRFPVEYITFDYLCPDGAPLPPPLVVRFTLFASTDRRLGIGIAGRALQRAAAGGYRLPLGGQHMLPRCHMELEVELDRAPQIGDEAIVGMAYCDAVSQVGDYVSVVYDDQTW